MASCSSLPTAGSSCHTSQTGYQPVHSSYTSGSLTGSPARVIKVDKAVAGKERCGVSLTALFKEDYVHAAKEGTLINTKMLIFSTTVFVAYQNRGVSVLSDAP